MNRAEFELMIWGQWPCKYGHLNCARTEGGLCFDETLSKIEEREAEAEHQARLAAPPAGLLVPRVTEGREPVALDAAATRNYGRKREGRVQ